MSDAAFLIEGPDVYLAQIDVTDNIHLWGIDFLIQEGVVGYLVP